MRADYSQDAVAGDQENRNASADAETRCRKERERSRKRDGDGCAFEAFLAGHRDVSRLAFT